MTISEQLTYSTLRIETKLLNGDVSTGTGFFYSFVVNGQENVPAIVTNKHVIKDASSGKIVFSIKNEHGHRLNDKVRYEIENFCSGWIPHPQEDVDLCILPIASHLRNMSEQNVRPHFISLDSSIIPKEPQWNELTPLEEIVMIGYPDGIWDKENNLPISRKGITATHPKKRL